MTIDELAKLSFPEADRHLRELVATEGFRVSELVDLMIQKAVLSKASDIHFEPSRRGIRVRFRIDGMFQDLTFLPVEFHDQVVSRIKVMADLISHRREVVQEGRLSISLDDLSQDLRVSIVPTVAGEKVVLRMFSGARETFDLDKLGYQKEMVRRISSLIFELQGMVILTGPSGSGKTTTLYSLLHEIIKELDAHASVVSIEDPVEYEFGKFAQIQVDRQIGLDFANGLKAVLRQDPECIMVGEIRDTETCEVALRAGLTGHLVITTIHAGSSCEVVTRILNMGIEPFIVASALTGVIAQRLVRLVCSECSQTYTPERSKVDFVERTLGSSGIEFKRGRGCGRCQFSGYSGRLPVAELLEVDEPLRTIILEKASTATLRKFAVGRGMVNLLQDGLQKVASGLTTIDEVLRVVSMREVAI